MRAPEQAGTPKPDFASTGICDIPKRAVT